MNEFINVDSQEKHNNNFHSQLVFMTPSIATKFQYVNSLLFFFLTHYMFRPLRAIFRLDIQLGILRTIFNTTDPLHVHNLM
jgi:hypothetical protein